MIDNDIREILKEREAIHVEDYISTEQCWEKEIRLLSKDINKTIDFISNRCTGEEFAWLSEVFDEVVEKCQSEEFIACLQETVKKFPSEAKEYNLIDIVESAKSFLEQ